MIKKLSIIIPAYNGKTIQLTISLPELSPFKIKIDEIIANDYHIYLGKM
jgi:glycosyltransferase involved in cell wall biosynthesis